MTRRKTPHAADDRLTIGELDEVVRPLRAGVDRVLWMITPGEIIIIDRADLPDVERFLDGTTDQLTLPRHTFETGGVM
jgi:hypothetical protein